jgi:hypothetical protein
LDDIVDPIDDVDKTAECFEEAMQQMYHKYVGAEARDTYLEYFKMDFRQLNDVIKRKQYDVFHTKVKHFATRQTTFQRSRSPTLE